LIATASAVVYVIGSTYLWSYSAAISRFLDSKSVYALEKAVVAQKSFWKLIGIMSFVTICVTIPLALFLLVRFL